MAARAPRSRCERTGSKGPFSSSSEGRTAPISAPPLSKEYLSGEQSFESLLICPDQFWKEQNVKLLLGKAVIRINPADKVLTQSDGTEVGYNHLVWAAGGDSRPLPYDGAQFRGVHIIRTRSDIDRLVGELDHRAKRVAVIGGGYIALESAAAMIKRGCSVVLLETEPRVLSSAAGNQVSQYYQAKHRARGVDLRTDVLIGGLEGDEGRFCGIRMSDGSVLAADLAIFDIGIAPNVGPLLAAGAIGVAGGEGVLVDENCRTSLLDIYALGDCAAYASEYAEGEVIRLESVQNADDMAIAAARSICGKPEPYTSPPCFWSRQYDLELQSVGLSAYQDMSMLTGNPADQSFSVIYLRGGRLIAIDCVNSPEAFEKSKALVAARTVVAPPPPYPVKP